MYNFLYKYKSFLFNLLKIAIAVGACYLIIKKLTNNNLLSFNELVSQLAILFSNNNWKLLALLLFTDLNWLLETFKWKNLASTERKLSFLETFEQCLASHTVSITTPNRIGEYGAKALFFEKEKRSKILVLNLIGNLFQLLTTIIFGAIGIIFIASNYSITIPTLEINRLHLLWIILFIFLGLFLLFSSKNWLNKTLLKALNYLKRIPKRIIFNVGFLSFLRYLTFSHQFYFLLLLFQVDIDYFTGMSLIYSMYLLASILPTLSIFDWVLKSSIAVLLFEIVSVNPLTILTITTIMWVLNFAIPALLGSVFVLNLKLPKE